MKILDGKIVRDKIAQKLSSQILALSEVEGSSLRSKPKLTIIQVGNLSESNAYIRQKVLFGQKIGAIVELAKLGSDISQETLNSKLLTLSSIPQVHGIIIQLPIPKHLDKNKIVDSITPAKDVDGQTSTNLKKLIENNPTGFIPATTKGIVTLLNYYKIPIPSKNITVVGRSSLVGKPTALALLNLNATVTICHRETKNLTYHTKNADILIVAAGKPNLITRDHVASGQVVIDVGINMIQGQKSEVISQKSGLSKPELENERSTINDQRSTNLVGDVKFDEVSKIVAAITPVPGGIGPMTVASLFENLLEAYTSQT